MGHARRSREDGHLKFRSVAMGDASSEADMGRAMPAAETAGRAAAALAALVSISETADSEAMVSGGIKASAVGTAYSEEVTEPALVAVTSEDAEWGAGMAEAMLADPTRPAEPAMIRGGAKPSRVGTPYLAV